MFKFLILMIDLFETIQPFHLLGLNGLIGVIANLFEFKDNIGPWTERLYAVLPAGVDTKTPSDINFLIIVFYPFNIFNEAVCLLCLNIDISLIAILFFNLLFLVLTIISKGEIIMGLAFEIYFNNSLVLGLFIKKPYVPVFIP